MKSIIYVRINTGEILKYTYTDDGVTCEDIGGDIYEVEPGGYGYDPKQLYNDAQNAIVGEEDWDKAIEGMLKG